MSNIDLSRIALGFHPARLRKEARRLCSTLPQGRVGGSRGRVVHPADVGALLMQIVEDAAGMLDSSWLYYWASTSLRAVGAFPRNTSRPV